MSDQKLTRRDYDTQISDLKDQITQKQQTIISLATTPGNNTFKLQQEENTLQVMEDTLRDLEASRNQCTY